MEKYLPLKFKIFLIKIFDPNPEDLNKLITKYVITNKIMDEFRNRAPEINLYLTHVKQLPVWIGKVKNIKSLYIQESFSLHSLPGTIGKITTLKHLDVEFLPIYASGIPESLKHLTDLVALNITIRND